MSAAHTAIVTALGAATAVTDIVDDRIYGTTAPQGIASPHIIFQHIATTPAATHGEATGNRHRLFQFACFAATPTAARALRDAVVTALDNATLSNGDRPTLEDERDGDFDDAAKLARADADFLV